MGRPVEYVREPVSCPVCQSEPMIEARYPSTYNRDDQDDRIIRCSNTSCLWFENFTKTQYYKRNMNIKRILISNWNMRALKYLEVQIVDYAIAQKPIPHPVIARAMNARKMVCPSKYGSYQ